jgi:cobalt-zinc-cadmium efflux system outer membrane protein
MFRFVLLVAGACSLSPWAAAQVLTLNAARDRALMRQPALAALELNAHAIAEAAPAERALPDPRLKFGLLNLPTRNFPRQSWEEMTQLVVSYEQMVPGGDKRRLREARMLAEAEQARAESGGQRQTILREVGLAWVDAWQALAAEKRVRELGTEFGHAAELARIGVASGRGSQPEIFASRRMQSMVTDRGLELAAQAERARAMLRRWVPDAGAFDTPAELPAWRAPQPPAALAATLEHHPQHAMHVRAQGTAEVDVALAREATAPDRSFEVGYGFRAGMNRSDMLMFQVAFELPAWRAQKQDRLVAAKLKLAERAREQRADHLRELRAELDAAYADWRLAGERLANFERAVLPAARGRLETLAAAHSAGRAELAQVLEARRELIELGLQELALSAARAKARVAIEYFEHQGK